MQNRTERCSAKFRRLPTLKVTSCEGDSPPLWLPFPGAGHSMDVSAGGCRRDGCAQHCGQRPGSSMNALHPFIVLPQC